MENSKLSCARAREWDMVLFLSRLGYEPQKIKGNNYWYCSPLRNERTASFKIDRYRNRWKDFGDGRGGSLIDFGLLYYRCSIPELLQILAGDFSFQRPILHQPVPEKEADKITIKRVLPLSHPALLQYLGSRHIDIAIAERWSSQVYYRNGARNFFSIGFKNEQGGYELRSRFFKGSSSPKTFTYVKNGCKKLAIFEGFFDFLSFLTYSEAQGNSIPADYLVLNSLSFLTYTDEIFAAYEQGDLYLDRNGAGINATLDVLSRYPAFKDRSTLYMGYEDLNDWLCNKPMQAPSDKGTLPEPEPP